MKRMISLALAVCLLAVLSVPAAAAPEGPAVNAKAVCLMEKVTGRVLYEVNSHEALAPASVTKVMSLLLIFEALSEGRLQLGEQITVSEHAASMGGSQIYLEPGEQMSTEDMLKAVVVSSANDAVVALGEQIAGSETAFVSLMNTRAEELGMANTHFVNCSGLDAEGHVTSAYDIALMSRELLLNHPDVKKYTMIWMDSVRDGQFHLANTNKLLRTYTGTTGLKTGFTSTAGSCLSGSAERGGMELICSILGSPNSKERFAVAKNVFDYGFANYSLVEVFPEGVLMPIPVRLGTASEVQPILSGNNRLILEKGSEKKLTRTVTLEEGLEAPVEKDRKIGEMVVESEGTILLTVPIVAAEAIPRLSFKEVYTRLLKSILIAG